MPRRTVNQDSTSRFTRKGLATRTRIVGVAARLMFERGVANTSIDEVRSTAGVGGSQISHYFRDKRDLTRQVIAARRDDVMAFHSTVAARRARQSRGFASVGRRLCSRHQHRLPLGGCIYGSLAGELIDADDEIRDDLAAGYDQWLELFQTGLTRCGAAATCSPDADPRHLAVSLRRRSPGRRDAHSCHRRCRTAAGRRQCCGRLRPLVCGTTRRPQVPYFSAPTSFVAEASGLRWPARHKQINAIPATGHRSVISAAALICRP